MKLKELRKLIPPDTTIWLQGADDGNCIGANENQYVTTLHDEMEVVTLYNEKFPAYGVNGILIIVR